MLCLPKRVAEHIVELAALGSVEVRIGEHIAVEPAALGLAAGRIAETLAAADSFESAAYIAAGDIEVPIAANRAAVPSTELVAANLELVAERIAEHSIVERIPVPVARKREQVVRKRAADNKLEWEPHKLRKGTDKP